MMDWRMERFLYKLASSLGAGPWELNCEMIRSSCQIEDGHPTASKPKSDSCPQMEM